MLPVLLRNTYAELESQRFTELICNRGLESIPYVFFFMEFVGFGRVRCSMTSLLWSRILMTFHLHLTCFALSLDHFRHHIRSDHGFFPEGRTSDYVGHFDFDLNKAL